MFPAHLHQLQFLLAGEVTERELHGLVEIRFHTFVGHIDLVGSDADMADLPLFLRLQHTFVHAGTVSRFPALLHLMELVYIDAVCFQHIKRCLQILPELLRCLRCGLRGHENLVVHAFECHSQLLFTGCTCILQRILDDFMILRFRTVSPDITNQIQVRSQVELASSRIYAQVVRPRVADQPPVKGDCSAVGKLLHQEF